MFLKVTFIVRIYSSRVFNLIDHLIFKDYDSVRRRSLFYYVRK